MHKKKILTPAAVFMAGIIGAFLRLWEVNTIFELDTGLAKQYAFVSILLVILTAAVILMAVLYAQKVTLNIHKKRPFPVKSKSSVTVLTVIGIMVILCSLYNYFIDITETVLFRGVFAILGVGTGAAIISGAAASHKGNESKMGLLFCIATLFLCWWLIMTYKENNSNPVLLEYCYECLGTIAATLSFYYATGHYYGKVTPKRTVIAHLLGVYFCMVTALNAGNIAQGTLFVVLAIYQLIRVCAYVSGAPKKATIEE